MSRPAQTNNASTGAQNQSGSGVVRRYVPRRRVVFDEQQWPVNIVLVVLGGFLVGGIFAYQRFDDPRWYASPWLSLTLVMLLIGTTIMTLRMIDNRKFKRTMQFSVVVCAIVHLAMLIYSVESIIFSKGWQSEVTQKQLVRKKPRKQMEYHPTPQQQAEKPDFLKPIDSEVPEPTLPEVQRQQQEEPQTPQPVVQQPVPQPQPQKEPEVVRQNSVADSSQARQSATTSRLTKRNVKMPAAPQVTADVAQNTVRKNAQPQQNTPSRQVSRSQPAENTQKVTVPKITEIPAKAQANNVQRAQNQQAANTNNMSQATTVRKSVQSAELPKTQVEPVPERQAESQVSQKPIEVPRNTVARQQQTSSPAVAPQQVPPIADVPQKTNPQPVQRQSPSERQSVLASSPSPRTNPQRQQTPPVEPVRAPSEVPVAKTAVAQPAPVQPAPSATAQKANTQTRPVPPNPPAPSAPANPVRVAAQTSERAVTSPNPSNPASQASRTSEVNRNRRTDTSVPNPTATATAVQRPNQQAVPAPNPDAAQGSVARANTNRPTNRPQKLAAVENNPQTQTNQGATTAQRRESANQVSAANENQNKNSPQRSSRIATDTASPVNANVPANSRSVAANKTPSLDASRRAISRAEQGEAGAKTGRNLSQASAAADSASQVSATAAKRVEATRSRAANAVSSSDVASLQRSRTQADVAAAVLAPNPTVDSMKVASRQPAEQTLDASAATQRAAAANAVVSNQNAAQGSSSSDTGEPAVQAAEQFSRAAGGGQRQLSNEADNSEVVRTVSGQNFESFVSNVQAELAESAPGSAGQPAAAALAADNQSASRAESGAQQSLVGDRVETEANQENEELAAQIAQNDLSRNDQSRSDNAGEASELDEDMMSTAAVAGRSAVQRETAALNSADPQTVATVTLPGQGPANSEAQAVVASLTAGATAEVQRASTVTGDATAGVQRVVTASPDGQQVAGAETVRAESADAPNGDVVLGGGTATAQRSSQGPPLNAVAVSPVAMVQGAAESAGAENGVPVTAQGDALGKVAGGIQAAATSADVGAAAAAVVAQGTASIQGETVGDRREQSTDAVGDATAAGARNGSQLSRTQQGGTLAGDFGAVPIDVPQNAIPSPGETVREDPAGEYTVGPVSQPFAEAAPVNVNAEEGLGGLGEKIAADAGIADRRASAENATIQLQSSRFNRDALAGLPALDVHATMAKKSFAGRMNRDGGGNGSAGPETEEAIERGLAFLARYQKRDGSWSLQQFAVIDGVSAIDSDTAATALAMLAFQGAGYNHREHQYKDVVAAALNFILTHQTESGDYYLPQGTAENRVARLYGHAIATLAMCEAYGMTQDPDIKDSVQQALNFIAKAQHSERGGWRYTPGRESDTSVTGWMLMALESGRRAGLNVPEETFVGVQNWLDISQNKDQPFMYSYNAYAPVNSRQGQGRIASKTMTSVGLLMRLYLGWNKNDEHSIAGARYLEENLPSIRKTKDSSLRDTYYWYYATQYMYHMGGEHWKKWNDRLHPLLVNGQELEGELAGSWDPRRPVPDRWGSHAGRLYVTTMNLLSLEVHYRHLPLYSDSK